MGNSNVNGTKKAYPTGTAPVDYRSVSSGSVGSDSADTGPTLNRTAVYAVDRHGLVIFLGGSERRTVLKMAFGF